MTIKRTPLLKKQDSRGWLAENQSSVIRNNMRHFFISISKPNAVRGEHYHKRKIEWFLVLKGKALIVFKDIRSLEEKAIKVDGNNPEVVETSPMIAHSIKNIGTDTLYLMALVNEPLEQSDPDTFPYEILNKK